MSRIPFTCSIEKLVDHTAEVRELVLQVERPEGLPFQAGQFVMLHVPQDEGKPALRAYSIASPSQDSQKFRLLFKYVPSGVASEFVWKLTGSEHLQFTGPFGRMFLKAPTPRVYFLNTGTGISQHLSYLKSHRDALAASHLRLFFGVRTEKDIYIANELKALEQEFPHLRCDYVLSRASDSWPGLRGYVQEHLNPSEFHEATFYLCGNGSMIKQTKALLAEHHVPPERILAEAFD